MVMRGQMFEKQKTDQPDNGQYNLFDPMGGTGSTIGSFSQSSKSTSIYTYYLEQYRNRKRILFGAATAGAVALLRRAGQWALVHRVELRARVNSRFTYRGERGLRSPRCSTLDAGESRTRVPAAGDRV
jgi:hypothetical protein